MEEEFSGGVLNDCVLTGYVLTVLTGYGLTGYGLTGYVYRLSYLQPPHLQVFLPLPPLQPSFQHLEPLPLHCAQLLQRLFFLS